MQAVFYSCVHYHFRFSSLHGCSFWQICQPSHTLNSAHRSFSKTLVIPLHFSTAQLLSCSFQYPCHASFLAWERRDMCHQAQPIPSSKYRSSRHFIAFLMRYRTYHAVLYVTPRTLIRVTAETLHLLLITRNTVIIHSLSGRRVLCINVPFVAEISALQDLQRSRWRVLIFRNSEPPQNGQAKPFQSGHRAESPCKSLHLRTLSIFRQVLSRASEIFLT